MSTTSRTARRDRLSAPELAAWRGFLRVHAALVKELDAELERAHGLPVVAYDVLVHLEAGPMRMSELAESVLLSRSGLTRLVDRLVAQGLIERRRCPEDRRGLLAELTPEGRDAIARARPTHLDGVRRLFLSRLDGRDLEALARAWNRVLPGAADDGTGEAC